MRSADQIEKDIASSSRAEIAFEARLDVVRRLRALADDAEERGDDDTWRVLRDAADQLEAEIRGKAGG